MIVIIGKQKKQFCSSRNRNKKQYNKKKWVELWVKSFSLFFLQRFFFIHIEMNLFAFFSRFIIIIRIKWISHVFGSLSVSIRADHVRIPLVKVFSVGISSQCYWLWHCKHRASLSINRSFSRHCCTSTTQQRTNRWSGKRIKCCCYRE